jgi:HEPN domain-containing protein
VSSCIGDAHIACFAFLAFCCFARPWADATVLLECLNDLLNADNNLKSEIIPYDTVCFHCQQAAEKILKAYLVAKGMQPRFTHDLLLLLEEILPCCADAEPLRDDLALLMPYAVEVRYPDDLFVPTHEEAVEARQAAEHVLAWLQFHFDGLFL